MAKKPEPKRWKFRCKHCGCEWIADQDEVDRWLPYWNNTQMVTIYHAVSHCPSCSKITKDFCSVEPDEYNKLLEQVETSIASWKHFRLTT